MTPSLVICLRHGEKPGDAEDKDDPVGPGGPGLDQCGRVDRHALTLRGWQRAGALAGTALCGCLDGLERAPAILVPSYKDDYKGHRSFQTMLPLSARLGVEPRPVCRADEVDELTKQLEALEGVVVVCWEHDALAQLAQGLTGDAELDWPGRRFDVLWLVAPGETANDKRFEERDQRLLAGDRGLELGQASP